MRLQHFFTPDKSTVMSLACAAQSLYAGLVNGAVAVYQKAEGNCVCAVRASARPVSWPRPGVCCGLSCVLLGHIPASAYPHLSRARDFPAPKGAPQPHRREAVSEDGLLVTP